MSPAPGLLALAAVLGVVGGAVVWRLSRESLTRDLFLRTNVRGAEVPVGVGVVLPVTAVGAAAVLVFVDAVDVVEVPLGALLASVLAATGFGVLGLLDDLAGDGSSRGFAGHLRALAGGRLTTGAIKLFGGAALSVLVAAPTGGEGPGRLLADAALIALSANLANLLDRAPGRVGKAALLAAVPIGVAAGADPRLAGPVVVVGALVALLGPDLRERLMLGDTGANVLGGTLGLAAVSTLAPGTRNGLLVVVAVLNLASERISFTRVIRATPPLRWLDDLGRLP